MIPCQKDISEDYNCWCGLNSVWGRNLKKKKRCLGAQNSSGSSVPKKLPKIVNYATIRKQMKLSGGSRMNRRMATNIHLDQRPNNSTTNSYCPYLILKFVLWISSSLILAWWYPYLKWIFDKTATLVTNQRDHQSLVMGSYSLWSHCLVVYNQCKILGLHLSSLQKIYVLDSCIPSGSLREPVGVLASALLVHFTQVSTCWCRSHAWHHVMVMLKVFASCSFVMFVMKAYIASHMESHSLSHKHCDSRSMINHECRTCRLHHQSVMLNMCLDFLSRFVVNSCQCVLYDHICTLWSFTHLVIFVDVMMTKIHSNTQTITLVWTRSNIN